MMKALIHNTRVVQVVANAKTFPVHKDLQWVDAPAGTTTRHTYENGAFVAPSPRPAPPSDRARAGNAAAHDPMWRAWVRRQATKEGKTPQAIIDELKAEA